MGARPAIDPAGAGDAGDDWVTVPGPGGAPARPAPGRRRRPIWPAAGLGAGLAVVVASVAQAVALRGTRGTDGAALVAVLDDRVAWLLAGQVAWTAAAAGVLVVTAGLHRRLAGQAPPASLVPGVVPAGLAVVAAMALAHAVACVVLVAAAGGDVDDGVASGALSVVRALTPGWVGGVLAAAALAVAGLAHGAVPGSVGLASAGAAAVVTVGVLAAPMGGDRPVVALVTGAWLGAVSVLTGRELPRCGTA